MASRSVTQALLLLAAAAPGPPPADSLLSVIVVLVGLTLFNVGFGVLFYRRGQQALPRMTHSMTFAQRIAAAPGYLARLKQHPHAAPNEIQPGWRTLEVPGGVLASPCQPEADHEEVLACWAFYPDDVPPVVR